ncbi:MAG: S8 family serine peptidase [Verrucomicrobiota bacterium]|nr:S8 family serine peptidase [Verrucomicrobiota bacterium]
MKPLRFVLLLLVSLLLTGQLHAAQLIPNDPRFHRQWHLSNQSSVYQGKDMSAPAAWAITTGSTNVTVAILATGIRLSHPDLDGRIRGGTNLVDGNADYTDHDGLGTELAAIQAGTGNNHYDYAGIDWQCGIIAVKIARSNELASASLMARGINYAVSNGCKIITIPYGVDVNTTELLNSVSNAFAKNVLIVAPIGRSADPASPGNRPQAIGVSVTNTGDKRISAYGPGVDVAASGDQIDCFSHNVNGTSVRGYPYGAPQVAGVCSLLLSIRPHLTPTQLRALICAGGMDLVGGAGSGDVPGWDQHFGWGKVNAYYSLQLALTEIDQFNLTEDDKIQFSWSSPPNLSNKQPYELYASPSIDGPWEKLSPVFTYNGQRTTVVIPTSEITQFFRVAIREDWPDGT